jgi:hypothetical protein
MVDQQPELVHASRSATDGSSQGRYRVRGPEAIRRSGTTGIDDADGSRTFIPKSAAISSALPT